MQTIIQGSNDPIAIEVDDDLTTYERISAMLFQGKTLLKEWTTKDVIKDGNTMYFPIRESETLAFPSGAVTLDCKAYTRSGKVVFVEVIKFNVGSRENKYQFTGA